MEIGVLHKIVERVRQRLQIQKEDLPLEEYFQHINWDKHPRPFRGAFKQNQINVIAEIKFASPSEGVIREGGSAYEIARDYVQNGAVALSVLTEPEFFNGKLAYLVQVRHRLSEVPLLMKDFIVDDYQLIQARVSGADAVLLIAALYGANELKDMVEIAGEFELTPLVEVHDEAELDRALTAKATVIGINNRNLKTLEVSLDVSRSLIEKIPDEVIAISESGFKTHEQLREFQALGFDGFLIGTSLMKSQEPGRALAEILGKSP